MHSKQLILNRGPKIYNDAPMKIMLLNNPKSVKYYNLIFFYRDNMNNWLNSMFYSFRRH